MKIAGRRGRYVTPTEEMVTWFHENFPEVKGDDMLPYHDKRLIACIEVVQPAGWFVSEIPDTIKEYYPISTENDFIILTEEDLEYMSNHLIKIEDASEEKQDTDIQGEDV